jgi:ribosomal protein S18 acetylase RimI-like enzyme
MDTVRMNNMIIRKIRKEDHDEVLRIMELFMASDAVVYKTPTELLINNINNCLSDMPYLDGYVFIIDEKIVGYGLTAPSYTTEYSGICVWIEELYVLSEYRGQGIGTQFFRYIEKEYDNAVRFKLEVEPNNLKAIEMYKRNGFSKSKYIEMTKER